MSQTIVYHPEGPDRPSLILDPDTGLELTKHSDLWFQDGSVVFRAETVLFRVHISQLSRHSVCFRDMFALSSHKADGSVNFLDNCPVIFLHDKAEDVASLFTALYDGP